jgi:hypothetical protein
VGRARVYIKYASAQGHGKPNRRPAATDAIGFKRNNEK